MRSIPGCTHICGILEMNIRSADGTPDEKKIAGKNGEEYAPYDTFMALSDYNYLRQMLDIQK